VCSSQSCNSSSLCAVDCGVRDTGCPVVGSLVCALRQSHWALLRVNVICAWCVALHSCSLRGTPSHLHGVVASVDASRSHDHCPTLPFPTLPCPSLPFPAPALPCPTLPCPSLPCPVAHDACCRRCVGATVGAWAQWQATVSATQVTQGPPAPGVQVGTSLVATLACACFCRGLSRPAVMACITGKRRVWTVEEPAGSPAPSSHPAKALSW
jgi:hypothetical protein